MPPIKHELLDELLKGYKKPEDLLGQGGMLHLIVRGILHKVSSLDVRAHLKGRCNLYTSFRFGK